MPEFVTVDPGGRRLAGLHYPPANRDSGVAVLHLHGKGGNFYTGPGRRLPEHDRDGEFGHLAVNMRCHDLGYTDYEAPMVDARSGSVEVAGGMWEDLDAGDLDIRAAVDWLTDRGYTRVVLSGHSSGGYYVARYCADPANLAGAPIAARVLLSPVLSHRTHLDAGWFADAAARERAEAEARRLVAAGDGHRLIPIGYWYHAISAAALLQRVSEAPDIVETLLAASDLPLLMVGGARESRLPCWRDVYRRSTVERKEFVVVPDAEHNYLGAEATLFHRLASFVRRAA